MDTVEFKTLYNFLDWLFPVILFAQELQFFSLKKDSVFKRYHLSGVLLAVWLIIKIGTRHPFNQTIFTGLLLFFLIIIELGITKNTKKRSLVR